MTVYFKGKSVGQSSSSDRSRLRNRAGGLINYIWRAHLDSLAQAAMMTSVDRYHDDLLRYVRRDDHGEEVAAKLARNLLARSPEAIGEEIACLMETADCGDGLVEHLIISLRPGEELLEHFEEAVEILLDGLGLAKCPAVAAVHLDTDNPHLHIMVCRIDVDTGEPIALPRFDILRAHQLLAVMEDRFGWAREPDARWEVRAGRLLGDGGAIDLGPAHRPSDWPDENFSRSRCESAKARKLGQPDEISGPGIIREIVPPLVARNPELPGFLDDLADHGIELAMTGSNASYRIQFVDEDGRTEALHVKPSAIRRLTTAKLTDRFGALPEAYGGHAVKPRFITAAQLDRLRYSAEMEAYRDRLNSLAKALRAVAAHTDQPGFDAARASCIFPTFDAWAGGARPPDPANVLGQTTGAAVLEPTADRPSIRPEPLLDEVFTGRRFGNKIVYTSTAPSRNAPRITDYGKRIIILGPPTDAAIRLSLRILQSRGFEAVTVSGFTVADQKRVHDIAAGMGLEVLSTKSPRVIAEPKRSQTTPEPYTGVGRAAAPNQPSYHRNFEVER